MSKLQQNPLTREVQGHTFVINPQDAIYLIRRLCYRNNAREIVPAIISELATGGGETTNMVIASEMNGLENVNSTMWLSVERFEQYHTLSNDELANIYQQYPLFADHLGLFHGHHRAAQNWLPREIADSDREFHQSSVPTLITVNKYDPVTPPAFAKLFASKMNDVHLFILDEAGHGGGQQECRTQMMMEFMDDVAAAVDSECLRLWTP